MNTAQINSPRFGFQGPVPAFQGAVPAGHTLDEYRVLPGRYAGSFSKRSTWPLWVAALVIAAIAGAGFALYESAERNTATIESTTPSQPTPLGPGATTTDPSLPPAASNVPAPTQAATAKDSPATAPLNTPTKSEEVNSLPMVAQANKSVATKPAPVAAKKVVTKPVSPSPAKEVVPQSEPLTPPLPVKAEEPPPAPTPAPDVPAPVPAPVPTPVPAPTPQ